MVFNIEYIAEFGISKWTWKILFNIEEDGAYDDIGKIISKKCDHIVAKNTGFKNVEKIRGIIVRGKEVQIERNIAQNTMYFRHVSLTSVEVETSISKLKMILSDQRISLKTEHI